MDRSGITHASFCETADLCFSTIRITAVQIARRRS